MFNRSNLKVIVMVLWIHSGLLKAVCESIKGIMHRDTVVPATGGSDAPSWDKKSWNGLNFFGESRASTARRGNRSRKLAIRLAAWLTTAAEDCKLHVSLLFTQFDFVHQFKTHLWAISAGPACLTRCGRGMSADQRQSRTGREEDNANFRIEMIPIPIITHHFCSFSSASNDTVQSEALLRS